MLITEERLKTLFDNFKNQSVAVIGDVMLDRYIWGTVSRISPEAPVPVVDVNSETEHPGGASNVALNIRSLGAKPLLFGVIGNDIHGEALKKIFREVDISDQYLIHDASRPTTVKTRVIAHSQHVVRIDHEVRETVQRKVRESILNRFKSNIKKIGAIILQDYNKGVIDKPIIQQVVELAKKQNIPVCVDPKYQNFFEYTGVSVFKPNRKETEDALGLPLKSDTDYRQAAHSIMKRLGCKNVLLTLGERGMLLLQSDGASTRIPTRARNVADVSGAGDSVISTLAVMMASGATIVESAMVANIAGGLVCEEVGIVPVVKQKLFESSLTFNHLD